MTNALFLSCSLSRLRKRAGVRVAPVALARILIPRLLPQAREGANTEYPR